MSYGIQIRNSAGTRVWDNTRAGRVLHSRSLIGATTQLPAWSTTPVNFPDLTIPYGRTIEPFFTRPIFGNADQSFTISVSYPNPTTARATYYSSAGALGYSIVYFFLR